MPTFTTMVSMDVYIKKISEIVVHEVAMIAYNKLIENILDNYQATNVNYFDFGGRTGQFVESFILEDTVRELGLVFNEIKYDPYKMTAKRGTVKGSWNAHMSVMQDDVRENLASMLNVTGTTTNTSARSTGAFHGDREPYWDNTLEWIEQNYQKLFKEAYAKHGVKIQ